MDSFDKFWDKCNEYGKMCGVDPVDKPDYKESVPTPDKGVSYPWALFAVIFFLVSFTTLSGDSRKKNKQHEIFQQE